MTSTLAEEALLRPLIIGTAGHVDHGKTALVGALTGINTDRLQEEKRRGITIELGFAHLEIGGRRVGLVDVPGHERFVRAMVAGATGVDLVLVVVAADEGVMPQTREHLDICRLLGVRRGLVVLTKADLVDPEWLELAEADVRDALAGGPLEGAPVIPFSSVDPELKAAGLAAVRAELARLAQERSAAAVHGPLRVPVDRVFTMKGFGTVVTGTCSSGRVRVGQPVQLLPSGRKAKVRGLQVHGDARDAACRGERVALNLQGVERAQAARGEVVTSVGELLPSAMLDVRVELLPHIKEPLKQGARLLVHHGTRQALGRVVLLQSEPLAPGAAGWAQLRLAEPLVALPRDRVILRGFARDERHGATVGGGEVVLVHPPRRRRRDWPTARVALARVHEGGDPELVEAALAAAAADGCTRAELVARTGLGVAALGPVLDSLTAEGRALPCPNEADLLVHPQAGEPLLPAALQALREHHGRWPRRPGLEREELLSRVPGLQHARGSRCLLAHWVASGSLRRRAALLAAPGFRPQQDPRLDELRGRLAERLRAAGLTPPRPAELAAACGCDQREARELLDELVRLDTVVRIRDEHYVDAGVLGELQARLVAHLRQHEVIAPGEFKALVGGSRRYTIPLAEHFDRTKLTLRVGDARRLRRP